MKSHFPEYTKYFLKVALSNEVLRSKGRALLKGEQPHYPMHLTIAAIHVRRGSPYEVALRQEVFLRELNETVKFATSLTTERAEYALMGTSPECFALVFEEELSHMSVVREALSRFLCEELVLQRRTVLLHEQYLYTEFYSHGGEDQLRIKSHASPVEGTPLLHVTLLNSFDLKKRNKKLFAAYKASVDKLAFLSSLYGTAQSLLLECSPTLSLD